MHSLCNLHIALYLGIFELCCIAFPSIARLLYLSYSTHWGQQLLDVVTTDPFLNAHSSAIVHNEWPDVQRQVNIIFYKLYHLGGKSLMETAVKKWTSALNDKISVDWNTYDYLNRNRPMDISSIDGSVKAAIQVKDTDVIHSPSLPEGPVMSTYVNTYGKNVAKFVDDWSKRIGVATGKKPDNVQVVTPNPFGCFMAGTKVTLSNGQHLNIEAVKEGMKVLSHGGTISSQTKEEVANLMPENETVYGLNDENPFFSAGHALWTTEGWKAIAPEIAQEENPDLVVGALQVGDIVFRLVQFSPLLYEPIVIRNFTSKSLDIATVMYGLHLTGYKSYHANGYVVIMNYPLVTQRRLLEGIKKLNPEEKARLVTAVNMAVPELSKALGAFIPPVLANAGIWTVPKTD